MEAEHFFGQFSKSEAYGVVGAAAVGYEEDEGFAFGVEAGGGSWGSVFARRGLLSFGYHLCAAADDLASVGRDGGDVANGEMLFVINDQGGVFLTCGPALAIGHGGAADFGPVVFEPLELDAVQVSGIFGDEKVAVDGGVEFVAGGDFADGHERGFPRAFAVGVGASRGDGDVDGGIGEIDGEDVEVEGGVFTDFVDVGEAGRGAGGGGVGAGDGGEAEEGDGKEESGHGLMQWLSRRAVGVFDRGFDLSERWLGIAGESDDRETRRADWQAAEVIANIPEDRGVLPRGEGQADDCGADRDRHEDTENDHTG